MSILVTPIPRLTVLTDPAFTLGTTNAAGSAVTAIASDSTLLTFDAVAVDAITFGQSGAVGVATVASRRDHAHAMEAETATSFATQVEMEAASSTTAAAAAGTTVYAPGVSKAWVSVNQIGTQAILQSYNIASISDSAVGITSVTIADEMDAAAYCITACAGLNGNTAYVNLQQGALVVVGSYTMGCRAAAGGTIDADIICTAIFGALA